MDTTTIFGGMATLGLAIGAGLKVIGPIFKNGNAYVPRTECKIIHAGQKERDELIIKSLDEIKRDVKALQNHGHQG